MRITFSLLFILFLVSTRLFATHYMGGHITFSKTEDNFYTFKLTRYFDCGITVFQPSLIIPLKVLDSNSEVFTQIFLTYDSAASFESAPICSFLNYSTVCTGGTLFGYESFTYSSSPVFIPPFAEFTLVFGECCRNSSINQINSLNTDLTFFTLVKNTEANNSPTFNQSGTRIICANTPTALYLGANDSDGDILRYYFAPGKQNMQTNINYANGFSANEPIPGIVLDSITGIAYINHGIIGAYALSYEVREYGINGTLKSITHREIQIQIANCSNHQNNLDLTSINYSTNAIQNDSLSFRICKGESLNLELTFYDPDTLQILNATSNINEFLPAALITTSGTNPISLMIETGLLNQLIPYSFEIDIRDNHCPYYSENTYKVSIEILDFTEIQGNTLACSGDSVSLHASGGTQFTWLDLNNNMLIPGLEISCNPCQNAKVAPIQTTSYIVESNNPFCSNRDTITVQVVNGFELSLIASDTVICHNNSIQLNAIVTPPGVYQYNWHQSLLIDNNSPNQFIDSVPPGIHFVKLDVENSDGCIKTKELFISSLPAPEAQITQQFDCENNIVQLHAGNLNFNGYIPVGNSQNFNSNTDYPCVLGNNQNGAKHMLLYQYNESSFSQYPFVNLCSIGFEVVSLNNSATTLYQLSIRIGTTSDSTLNTGTNYSLTQTVFLSSVHQITSGWNSFNFSTPFTWPSNQNLLIEICYNNFSQTENVSIRYSATPFTSVIYNHGGGLNVCNSNYNQTSDKRANIRFGICGGADLYSYYNYYWQPVSDVSNPNLYNPIAFEMNQTYSVIISTPDNMCADTTILVMNNPDSLVYDCSGICNGPNLIGDIDNNQVYDNNDINFYRTQALSYETQGTNCTDLNLDGKIDISDLVMLNNCRVFGDNMPNQNGGVSNGCDFPFTGNNFQDTVYLKTGNVYSNYFEVLIKNPTRKVGGVQLDFKNIIITFAQNAVQNAFMTFAYVSANNHKRVIGFGSVTNSVAINNDYQLLCKVFYSFANQHTCMIDTLIKAVDEYGKRMSVVIDAGCLPLTLNKNSENVSLQIIPNPSNGIFQISLKSHAPEIMSLRVFNSFGEMVHSGRINAQSQNELNLSHLPKGLYELNILGKDISHHSKIIIQ
jgi:hypothetical protein